MKYAETYMFMSNDTYYKVFWLPHHGKVVKVIHIFKKINASIFRTGNCGGAENSYIS
jgi:hypothetical protein